MRYVVLSLVVSLTWSCGDDDTGGPADAGDELCRSALDCDDGTFCNGMERCDPDADNANAQGCIPGAPPCEAAVCDETGRMCSGCADGDGDGALAMGCGGDDCDDTDEDRYPGNTEVCDLDGHDEDCDDTTFGDRDVDGDGYVDARCCNGSRCGDDCDETRRGSNPNVPEVCDGRDNDCDGNVDEELLESLFADLDRDLQGDPDAPIMACGGKAGASASSLDCVDSDPSVNRSMGELRDGKDNDCDGLTDETPVAVTWYPDADGDGYGVPGATMTSDTPLPGYALLPIDCDDDDPARRPGATETCNAIDDDCDPDTGFVIGVNDWEDDDNDGHPDAQCAPTRLDRDCDDTDPITYFGAPERCDRRDNDCDGRVDESCDSTPPPVDAGVGMDAGPPSLDAGPVGSDGGRRDTSVGECTPDCASDEQCCAVSDGAECVRVGQDMAHCGMCGMACDPQRANLCVAGRCSCGTGLQCMVGEICSSSTCVPSSVDAGPPGMDSGPPCMPQPEACNGMDDDCDGTTDEAADASCDDALGCTMDRCNLGVCDNASTCGMGLTCYPAGCLQAFPGLVAYWPMSEGSGSLVADVVGINDLEIVGSPSWVSGQIGTALSFTTNVYAWLPAGLSSSLPVAAAPRSIAAWIRHDMVSTFEASMIIEYGDPMNNFILALRGMTGFPIVGRGWGAGLLAGTVDLRDGTWHHLVGVYTGAAGTNEYLLYVDGVLHAQRTLGAPETPTHGLDRVTVGTENSAHIDIFFGTIDELQVYDRVLTAGEVLLLGPAP